MYEKNDRELIRLLGADRSSAIEIPRDAKRLMGTLEDILTGDEDANEIICPNAYQNTLELLKKYVEHHLERIPAPITKPIMSSDLRKVVADSWDTAFCQNLSLLETLDLVMSAEYLNMGSLLDLLRALMITKIAHCTQTRYLK